MSTLSTNSKSGEINTTIKLTFTVPQSSKSPSKQQEEEEVVVGEEGKKGMFHSQSLLSSKGPLGNIWVAGYFFKRLKKRQINDTDIPSSVDKILLDGLPSITYRVLAYLLLGIVRIYSKKTEYLYQDCDQTVSDINRFSVSKKVTPFIDIVRSTPSISLPMRYELDTFQLEVTYDANWDHVSQSKDIILKELNVSNDLTNLRKHRFEEEPLHLEFDYAQTFSGLLILENGSSSIQTPEKLPSDKETSMHGHTPPDNVLSPSQQMDIDVELRSPNHTQNIVLSKEKLRDIRFDQDEGLGVDMICELDVELVNLVDEYDVQNNVHGKEDNQEKAPLEKHDIVMENDNEDPSPVEKRSGSDVANPSAAVSPKFVLAPTPVKEENFRRPYKRKCMLDETTVLSNEVMKLALKDASDLVCKRRKAPHTTIDLWRRHYLPALLKNFSEPIIPCVAMELKSLHCRKKIELQPSRKPEVEPVETIQSPTRLQVAVSPKTPADSRSVLAPGTPVRCPMSARVFGNAKGEDSDGEGIHSYDNTIREATHEENPGPKLMDEMGAKEGDSQELLKNKDGWSTRTRIVAKYLHGVCQAKKQQGKETVSLLPILKRKTKGESARLFFEILVLSSRGFVKVVQQKAYEDVVLEETSKMEAALG